MIHGSILWMEKLFNHLNLKWARYPKKRVFQQAHPVDEATLAHSRNQEKV